MVTPLTVVHIASGDLWAGAEVQLYNLARALRARDDIRLRIFLLNHGMLEERLRAARIAVEVFDERRGSLASLMAGVARRCGELKPEIIHSHRYKENLIAGISAARWRCLSVRTVHGAPVAFTKWRSRIARAADTLSGRYLQQAAVCVSPELLPEVQRRFPSRLVRVIENGIDIEEVESQARHTIDMAELGGGMRIGLVGRMVPVKRPDIFLAAAYQLLRREPGRYSFHLFGDGPLRAECQRFAERHGLGADLRFMGFRPELPAWLSRLDALVICSDHEGLPMVLLEAMALGVPVVAHGVGGIPHVLEGEEHGLLVRDHSPDAYVDAIRRLAAEPEATRARAARAAARVRNRFAVGSVAERYLHLYRELLAARRRRGSAPSLRPRPHG